MPTPTTFIQKETWPNDGTLHHDVSREALYKNSMVDVFLTKDRRTILISSKGMGKTLLLRAKKKILEETSSGHQIIPRNLEYDEPRYNGDLPATGYEDLHFWNVLWQGSIIFSILSHDASLNVSGALEPHLSSYIDQFEIDDDFKIRLKNDIAETKRNLPSYYLGELLHRSVGVSKRFARSIFVAQQLSVHYIKSGYYVFIDGFDQMLERHFSNSLDTWKNAQLGLLKAIHQLNTQNSHIKVYATVRQEAFAGFRDPDKEVIRGKSIILEYTRDELEEMFLHAITRYTNDTTLAEFFGTDIIVNQFYGEDERPFRYVYRHSASTPRSIMGFGHELSLQALRNMSPTDAQDTIRRKVNKISSSNVFEDYLKSQRQFFLKTLRQDEHISTLFSLLPTNILRGEDLQNINAEFARRTGVPISDSHPFCELFNIGLLGTLRIDPITGDERQYFKKPYEFEWKHCELVRRDRIYFLHPSLHGAIANERKNYLVNKKVLIGDGCKWPRNKTVFPLIFHSHSSHDNAWLGEFLPLFSAQMSLSCPVASWHDESSLKVGAPILEGVERGVAASSIVLVYLSNRSLQSKWVDREWRMKYQKEIESGKIQVIAITIDELGQTDVPDLLQGKKMLHLPSLTSPDFQQKLARLCDDIAHHIFSGSFFRAKGRGQSND